MKNILIKLFLLVAIAGYSQTVKIDSTAFKIKRGQITFYLDKDTASFVSVHKIKYADAIKIDSDRSNKWHKEKPYGPYKKNPYIHSGYDLGHLTPSNITSYNDTLNYYSFSFFNQAPQLAGFNRGNWAHLEAKVIKLIQNEKADATIITGVIYNNNAKEYLSNSRIKIPIAYYKILIIKNKSTTAWIGSNINGLVLEATVEGILNMARSNGNSINITVK